MVNQRGFSIEERKDVYTKGCGTEGRDNLATS